MSQADDTPRRPPSTPRVGPGHGSSSSSRGGQGPARRPCQVCGGRLTIGALFIRDGSQHREAECQDCGRTGLLTDRNPDAATGWRRFGQVFQASGGQR